MTHAELAIMTAGADGPRLLPPRPLGELGKVALFLDLDGTLADIQPRPQDVKPEPWRTSLLHRLRSALDGRVAVISGRTIEDVDRILDGAAPAVGAVHGLVRRRGDGGVVSAPASPWLQRAREEVAALARERPGLELEDKGLSLAVHYRRAPDLAELVKSRARTIAERAQLKLQLGDMVAEICAQGSDKGSAVRAFMRERPFEGALPVFVGDDLTDENGFEAARALGGMGVLVGPERATMAERRLAGVAAVRAWLEEGLQQETAK